MAWIRRELDALGIPPLKRFGQHFLVDKRVREELAELGELTENDTVLEVGPGLGFLTSALAARAGRVVAVEKDRTLAAYLSSKFSNYRNLTVVQGDALTVTLPEYTKVVSSPPYNISSKLILLILNSHYKLAALLLQEEFVRRLTALSGSRNYGRLTVMLQCRAQAEFITEVPQSAFYPRPRVDSALVTIKPKKEDPIIKDRDLFFDMVRFLFTQRRKRLRGVLTRYLKSRYSQRHSAVLQRVSHLEKRIYETSPQELAILSNQIVDTLSELERDSSGS